MIIRVDKCSSMGIKKPSTSSVQCLPKLILTNLLCELSWLFLFTGMSCEFNINCFSNHKFALALIGAASSKDALAKMVEAKAEDSYSLTKGI